MLEIVLFCWTWFFGSVKIDTKWNLRSKKSNQVKDVTKNWINKVWLGKSALPIATQVKHGTNQARIKKLFVLSSKVGEDTKEVGGRGENFWKKTHVLSC